MFNANIQTFFSNNKAAIAIGTMNIAKTLLDNYWAFSIGLANEQSKAERVMYLAGQILLAGGLGAAGGWVVDELSGRHRNQDEIRRLNQ